MLGGETGPRDKKNLQLILLVSVRVEHDLVLTKLRCHRIWRHVLQHNYN